MQENQKKESEVMQEADIVPMVMAALEPKPQKQEREDGSTAKVAGKKAAAVKGSQKSKAANQVKKKAPKSASAKAKQKNAKPKVSTAKKGKLAQKQVVRTTKAQAKPAKKVVIEKSKKEAAKADEAAGWFDNGNNKQTKNGDIPLDSIFGNMWNEVERVFTQRFTSSRDKLYAFAHESALAYAKQMEESAKGVQEWVECRNERLSSFVDSCDDAAKAFRDGHDVFGKHAKRQEESSLSLLEDLVQAKDSNDYLDSCRQALKSQLLNQVNCCQSLASVLFRYIRAVEKPMQQYRSKLARQWAEHVSV